MKTKRRPPPMPTFLIAFPVTEAFDTAVDTDEKFVDFARTDMDTFQDNFSLYGRRYKIFRQWGGGTKRTPLTFSFNLN